MSDDQTPPTTDPVTPVGAAAETPAPAEPDPEPEIDARAIATRQIKRAIGKGDVPDAKRDLAIARHTKQVRAAGVEVDLDWWTHQFIDPARTR